MAELKQLIEQILSGQLIAKREEWIDRNAIAPLVDELKSNSLGLARQAADAIVAMSPEAESIRFLMLQGSDVLKQERIQRRLLVLAIRLAQRQPESFLPLLQDESAEVRLSVAEALWEAGVARSEALVSIVESLDDEQCAKPALLSVRRHLHTSMPLTRVWAAYALWKIEGTSAEAVATLACILRDDSDKDTPSARVLAAQLLEEIGIPAKQAASALRFATLSRKLHIREAATQALASLDCKE